MPDLDKIYDHILDQFSDTPNWQKYYKVFCELTDELNETLVHMMSERWLDTAEGHWLDVCGTIIGLPRPEAWLETGVFTWDSNTPGERWDEGVWSVPEGLRTGVPVSDTVYRALLRAKAFSNGSDSSLYSIASVINIGFGIDFDIETSGPRVVSITFNETVSQWDRYYIRELAPVQGDTDLVFTN